MQSSSNFRFLDPSGRSLHEKEWTHIVLGGGTAGCQVAFSLAADPAKSVLLIEAGESPPANPIPPVAYPSLFGSQWDWGFRSQPQTELGGRRLGVPRGKGLGGSSLINAMIALGGDRSDWNRWGENVSDLWSFDSVYQTLRMRPGSENTIPESNSSRNCSFTETAKDVHPSFPPQQIHPLSQTFLATIEACCGPALLGSNRQPTSDDELVGPKIFPVSIQDGRRLDAWNFHSQRFAKLAGESLLHVCTGCLISRLILEHGKCTAIELLHHQQKVVVGSNCEIILCCGAIGTPAILMRSGVGSTTLLSSLGIDIQIAQEEIGANLQDQPMMPVIFQSQVASLTKHALDMLYGSGKGGSIPQELPPDFTSNIAEVGAFLRFSAFKQLASSPESDLLSPDLQIHFTPTHYLEYPLREHPTDAFTLGMTLLHPKSRGKLWIESADPHVQPLIDFGFLTHPADLEALIDAVEIAREIGAQPPLANAVVEELIPGNGRKTRSQIARAIRAYTQSIYHPLGTCRMGKESESPVSPDLRLRGSENVRIIDASVLPDQPSCNPAAVLSILSAVAVRRFY